MRSSTSIFIAALIFVWGCSSTGVTAGKRSYNPRIIEASEIGDAHAENAYDLIQRLRPHWLSSRGASSFNDPNQGKPTIYYNGSRMGDVDALLTIQVDNVANIRFYKVGEPGMGFGASNHSGVIAITTF